MRFYLLTLLFAVFNALHAKQIESIQSGNWTSSTTWKNGTIPSKNDSVVIQINHHININKDSIVLQHLKLNGNIQFANAYLLKSKVVECENTASLASNYFMGSLQIDSLFWVKGSCAISNAHIISKGWCSISGTLIMNSDAAQKEFDNIYIKEGGKWNNNNNGDPKISGDIINNGTFISCKNTGCTYHFSNSVNFLGDSTTYITRMNCAPSTSIVNSGKLHVLLSIDGDPILTNKKTLTLSLSAFTFHVAQFNTNSINNTVIYADTNEQEIFTPTNGYYENLVLKNGRKILTQNLIIKEKLELKDSAILAQQTFAIKGMNSAILNIDSTSTLSIGSNDYETTQGFPTEFTQLNLHRFSTVLYQSKKDEFINSTISYGNLSIDDGAVAESIKTIENDSLRVRGNLWIAESSVKLKCNLCDIQCQGDWDGIGNLEMTQGLFQLKGNGNNYGVLYPGNGEVLYNGEANQIIKIGNYNILRIKKNGGKTTLKGNANTFICKKLINEKSLLEIGNETVNITDSLINHDVLHFTSIQQSRSINDIVNKPTASLIFKVATTVHIKGDWINQGNFNAGLGKIIFSDSTNHQKIIGNSTFNKIEITKSKKSVELNNDITIQAEIKLNSGKLNLLNNTITLTSNSKITNENAQNYIYGNNGKIILNKVINENSKDTVNGIGLIIQSSVNWGNTQFIRKHHLFNIEGQNTIKRQFEIHPTNNANLNEKVTFYYLPHELENNNHQQLGLYKSEDEIIWQNISGLKDTNLYSITVNGINSFSTWTFKNIPNNPLPVKWLETTLINQQQTLFWSTASEQNVSYFEIQNSEDGIHFNTIEILKACGTCNYINEYYIELGEQYNNEYLRIKSVDFDGQTSYSIIIQKSINNSSIGIQIRNNELSISNIKDITNLEIYNLEGKLILHQIVQKDETIKIDLPKGIYFYRINEKTGKLALTN
jgi:hypothetical protein